MLLQCDVTPLVFGAGYAVESMDELIRRAIAIGRDVHVSDPIQGGELGSELQPLDKDKPKQELQCTEYPQ